MTDLHFSDLNPHTKDEPHHATDESVNRATWLILGTIGLLLLIVLSGAWSYSSHPSNILISPSTTGSGSQSEPRPITPAPPIRG